MADEKDQCEQDDHDRVWQMGREAGYRDALLDLAERGGALFDVLDREIADSLRRDRQYVEAYERSTVVSALRAFLDFVASNAAYNGAGDQGQQFYDWSLNPWLNGVLSEYLDVRFPPGVQTNA